MPKVRIVIEAEINEETMQECGCSLEEVKNNIVLWESDVIDGFELTTNISGLDNTSEFFLQNGKIIKTELRNDTMNFGRNTGCEKDTQLREMGKEQSQDSQIFGMG